MKDESTIDSSVQTIEAETTSISYEVLYMRVPSSWAVQKTDIEDVDRACEIADEVAKVYRRVEVRRITRTYSVHSIWRTQ